MNPVGKFTFSSTKLYITPLRPKQLQSLHIPQNRGLENTQHMFKYSSHLIIFLAKSFLLNITCCLRCLKAKFPFLGSLRASFRAGWERRLASGSVFTPENSAETGWWSSDSEGKLHNALPLTSWIIQPDSCTEISNVNRAYLTHTFHCSLQFLNKTIKLLFRSLSNRHL